MPGSTHDSDAHLADDRLDVLVVDRHTLLGYTFWTFSTVRLRLHADALDLEELLRVDQRLVVTDETVADPHVAPSLTANPRA